VNANWSIRYNILFLILNMPFNPFFQVKWLFCTGNATGPSDPQEEPSSTGSEKTDNKTDKNAPHDTEEIKKIVNLPIVGNITIDYSRINEGIVVLLINGTVFLNLNLHYILGALSKNSRKKLSAWLIKGDIAGWPLSTSSSSSTEKKSSEDQKSTGDPVKSDPTDSSSQAAHNLSKKLSRLLGLDLAMMSNSVLDTVRQMLKSGDIKFAIRSSIIDKNVKNANEYRTVDFSEILSIAREALKSKRSVSKKSEKSASSTTSKTVVKNG